MTCRAVLASLVRALFVVALASSSAPAGAPPAARELLDRASATHRSLTQYRLAGTKIIELTRGGATQRVQSTVVLAAAPGGKSKVELTGQIFDGRAVSNGESTWVYVAQLAQYSAGPASAPVASGGLQGSITTLFASLRDEPSDISKNVLNAMITREDTLHVSGLARRCRVVEVIYQPGADSNRVGSLPKKVWIDEELNLVLRTQVERRSLHPGPNDPDRWVETNSFEQMSVGQALPDSEFAFHAPSGARRVAQFEMPGQQVQGDLTGTVAADFTLKDLANRDHALKSLRGKVVLLDFWATWCGPCRMEMPSIVKLSQEFKDKGLVVLGINMAEDPDRVRAFLKQNNYAFTVLMDSENLAARLYRASAIPTVVVVDPQGKVAAHFVGVQSEENLRAALFKAGVKK